MNIHQLSVNYIQEHDRILVRINTTAGQELRLWFTRRLTLGLMPMLQQIVTQWVVKQEALKSPYITPAAAADAPTQQMLAEFKKEEALQNSDFQTPYKTSNTLLLGPEPLLATEVSVTHLANNQLALSFHEKISLENGQFSPNSRSFRVALEQNLIHGLMHLLSQALSASQWSDATSLTLAATAEPSLPGEGNSGGGDRPKYLN